MVTLRSVLERGVPARAALAAGVVPGNRFGGPQPASQAEIGG
jgi:hypothetical protein